MPDPSETLAKRPATRRRGDDANVAASTAGTGSAAASQQPVIRIGRVKSYSVAEDGLRIKLDSSAISRSVILVRPDAPHFRAAVSIAMLAYNARYTKSTFNDQPTIDNQYIAARIDTPPLRSGVEVASAVGLGEDSLDLSNWIMRYEGGS